MLKKLFILGTILLVIAQSLTAQQSKRTKKLVLYSLFRAPHHYDHDINCNLNLSGYSDQIKYHHTDSNGDLIFNINCSDTVTEPDVFFFSLNHYNYDFLSEEEQEVFYYDEIKYYCGYLQYYGRTVNLLYSQNSHKHFGSHIFLKIKSTAPIKINLAFQDGQYPDFEGTRTDTIGYQIELSEEFQSFSLLPETPYVNSSGNLLDLSNISFLQISLLPDENGIYPNLNNETITISHIDFFEDGFLGINDAKETESNLIYPNPTNGELNFNKELNILKIDVYNLNGELIKSMTSNEGIEELEKGLYIIQVTTPDGVYTEKTIKQ